MGWLKRSKLEVTTSASPGSLGRGNSRHECSFCMKERENVRFLLGSDRAVICNDCILLCMEVLVEREPQCTLCGTREPPPIKQTKRGGICAQCARDVAVLVGERQ